MKSLFHLQLRLLFAFLLVGAVVLSPAAGLSTVRLYGQSTESEADLDTALAALEYQADATESWIIEFTKKIRFRNRADEAFQEQVMRQVERRFGERFYVEEEELNAKVPETRWFEHRTFDGERQMTYSPEESHGSITSSDIRPSLFGRTMYLEPYSGPHFPAVLIHWERLDAPQWVVQDGRRLLSLKLHSPELLSEYEFRLDPAHSWQPAECTSTSYRLPGGTKETSDWTETRYVYQSYHQDGDICLPTKLTFTVDNVQPGGGRFRSWEGTVEVTSIQLNPDLSAETFTIDFPKGTQVYDKDRQVTYTVGEAASEKPVRATIPTEAPAVAPNPAAPPWWGDYRVWIALAVACVAGALWWRWREQR